MTGTAMGRWLAALMCLALTGCMFSPGKFVSNLDVRQDGAFSFSYAGEIHLLVLSKLAQMGRGGTDADFTPQPCNAEGSGEERSCTEAEVNRQKAEWAEQRAQAENRRKRENEQMKAILGGIDPSDPKAAEELAGRLRRQAGWRKVDYKGDGLFEVDFAIAGRIDHDFAFPTIERFPSANAFVTVSRRADGSLRIDAPAFGAVGGMEPWKSMMRGAAMEGAERSDGKAAQFPLPDGRFTITTDAAVLANNTEAGPETDLRGTRLAWTVTPRSDAAPMALLRLSPDR